MPDKQKKTVSRRGTSIPRRGFNIPRRGFSISRRENKKNKGSRFLFKSLIIIIDKSHNIQIFSSSSTGQ